MEDEEIIRDIFFAQQVLNSVVDKKLGYWLKVKLRRLKEGAKHLVLSAEVHIVLYRAITG